MKTVVYKDAEDNYKNIYSEQLKNSKDLKEKQKD